MVHGHILQTACQSSASSLVLVDTLIDRLIVNHSADGRVWTKGKPGQNLQLHDLVPESVCQAQSLSLMQWLTQ